MKWAIPIIGISIGIILGVGVGFVVFGTSTLKEFASTGAYQVRAGTGHFTNPLLECDLAEGTINATKADFDDALNSYVQKIKDAESVSEISVYFRDLNNGPTFGVDQGVSFIPASLMKVPVMMAYYKAAETDPGILQKKITIQPSVNEVDIPQLAPPAQRIVVGNVYTVADLIHRMITYSDNQSLISLYGTMPVQQLTDLYSLLEVNINVMSDPTATLSVKDYSSFFRILYNASYLSQKSSEQALADLSATAFTDGLRAGVPDGVAVAHKFGERLIDGVQQFHDCGIIYYPKHPYLLCVMTRGKDIPTLEKAIAGVSRFVYEKIDVQYANK